MMRSFIRNQLTPLLVSLLLLLVVSGSAFGSTYDPDAPLKEPGHLPQTILNAANYKTPPVTSNRNAVIYKALFSFDPTYHSAEFLPDPFNTLLDYYRDSKGRIFLKVPICGPYKSDHHVWLYMGSDRFNLARLPMDPRNMTSESLDAHVNCLEQFIPPAGGNPTQYVDAYAPIATVLPDPIIPDVDPNQAPGSLPMTITNAKNYKTPPDFTMNNGRIEGIFFNWDSSYHSDNFIPTPINSPLTYYRDNLGRFFIKAPGKLWMYMGSDHYNLCTLPCEPYLMNPNVLNAYVNMLEKHLPNGISYPVSGATTDSTPLPEGIGAPPRLTPSIQTPIVSTEVVQPIIQNDPYLAAYYKFEGNLEDSSGNGNDGYPMGPVAYTTSGASGQALSLDGGYVKIPGNSSLNLGEKFTFSAWVKMDQDEVDINNYNAVFYKENIGENRMDEFHYYTAIQGTSDARLELEQLSTGFEPIISTPGIFPQEFHTRWAMVTWVSDGDTLYLYIDGKLNTTNTTGKQEYDSPFLDRTTAILFIGGPANDLTDLLHGQLDEAKLYSRALTGAEIKAQYDAIKGGGSHTITLWIGQNRLISDNLETTIDSAPVILNGRTLVPVRPIIEAMGGTVAYDATERRIDLALKGKTLTLWIDQYNAVVNGQNVTLEVPPTVINGRTMLPLRFAAESLGATLEWDAPTQKITLRYNK